VKCEYSKWLVKNIVVFAGPFRELDSLRVKAKFSFVVQVIKMADTAIIGIRVG
jgi:hypothetical protein